nr:MAG TPA: hypothetical protein [Caudoviricetes sp.]
MWGFFIFFKKTIYNIHFKVYNISIKKKRGKHNDKI